MKNLLPRILRNKFISVISIAFLTIFANVAQAQLFSYTAMDQQVNDITYSQSSGMIYASVPSTGGAMGNYIVVINPRTRQIINSVFAGSEPNRIALTSDEKYLYVGLDGSASVKRLSLENMTFDQNFALGSGSNGAYYAENIAPLQNRPEAVAISRRNFCCSPRHEGVAIYVNGSQLTTTSVRTSETNEIVAGDDATTLYGYGSESSEFAFRRLAVDQNGVSIAFSQAYSFGAYNLEIRYLRGMVYASNGKLVTAASGLPGGSLAVGGFANGMTLDKRSRRAFFVMGNILSAFKLDTFQPVGSASIPDGVNSRARLVRWGRRGLAYRINDGRIAIAESMLVSQKV